MTHYPNDPPLMWLQERRHANPITGEAGTPLIIGCTACPWQLAPGTGKGGWQRLETLYNNHLRQEHGKKQRPIVNPDDQRHGTYPGYRAHLNAGTPACRPCRDAANTYNRQVRPRRKAVA